MSSKISVNKNIKKIKTNFIKNGIIKSKNTPDYLINDLYLLLNDESIFVNK